MSASSISVSPSSSPATTANALTPRNVERVVELSCWHHPYAVGRHVVRLDFDHDEKLEMIKLQNKHGPAAVAAVAAASGGVDAPHAFALDSSHHYHGLTSNQYQFQYQQQQQQQQYYPPASSSSHNHVDQSLVLYFHQPRCATAFRAALLCVTQRPKPTTYSLIATLPSRPSAAAVAEAEYAHQQRLASAAAGHPLPFKHLLGDEDMSAAASCKELIHIARKTKVKNHRDVLFSYLGNPHDGAATTTTNGAPPLNGYQKKDYHQQQQQQQVNNANNISPSTTATTTATATPTASGSSSGDDLSVVDNRPQDQQQHTTATLRKEISITHHNNHHHQSPNGLDHFSATSHHSSSPAAPLYLVRTIAKSDLKLAPPGPRRPRSNHSLRSKDDRLHAHSIDRYSRGRTRTRAAFSSKYSDALSRSRSRSRSRTRTSHLNHDRRSGIDHGDQLSSSSSSAAAAASAGVSSTNEGMTPALRSLVNERMSWECVMRCRTPFVLRLVDAIESVRHVHLVSECAAFGSLARILTVCRRPSQRLAEPAVRALFAELVLAVFDLHSSAGLVHNDLAVHAVHVTHTGHARLAEFSSATPSLLGANLSPDLYHYHYHHEQLFNPGPPPGASSPSLHRMGPLFRFQHQYQSSSPGHHHHNQPYDPLLSNAHHHHNHHRHPHFDEPDDPDSPFCHHPARDMWGLGTILYCLLFGPVAVFSKFSSPTIPTHAQALVQCDLSTRAGRRRARGCVIVNVVHQQRQQRQRQRQRQLDKQQQEQHQEQQQKQEQQHRRRRRIRRRNADASTTTATSTTTVTSVLMGDDDLVSSTASTMMHAAATAGYNDSSEGKILDEGFDFDESPLVSDAAIDLVHALLHHDDSSRIDMYGVMGHPWLANTDWHAVRARAVDNVSVPVVVDALHAAHVTPVYPDQTATTTATTAGGKAGGTLDNNNNNGHAVGGDVHHQDSDQQHNQQDGAAAAAAQAQQQQQQVYDDDASFRNLLNKHLACASLARPLCPSCLPPQAQSPNKAYSTTSSNGRRPSGFSSSSSAYHHHHHNHHNNNNNSDTDERDSMSSSISRASTYNKLAAGALQRIARGFGAGRSNPIPMGGSSAVPPSAQQQHQRCVPDAGATTTGCTGGGGGSGGGGGVVGAGVTATGTPVGPVPGGKTAGTDIRSDKALVGFDFVV